MCGILRKLRCILGIWRLIDYYKMKYFRKMQIGEFRLSEAGYRK